MIRVAFDSCACNALPICVSGEATESALPSEGVLAQSAQVTSDVPSSDPVNTRCTSTPVIVVLCMYAGGNT